jgi:pyruvate/2-oxoglutarate dehydrogenase complex dihydrolipoamide acyltransferase (E2) component
MGRRYDDRRWVQNPDGSFSRIAQAGTAVEEHSDAYYEDLATTGAAAELAEQLDVDLSTVKGTGKNGRITKADVEAAAGVSG